MQDMKSTLKNKSNKRISQIIRMNKLNKNKETNTNNNKMNNIIIILKVKKNSNSSIIILNSKEKKEFHKVKTNSNNNNPMNNSNKTIRLTTKIINKLLRIKTKISMKNKMQIKTNNLQISKIIKMIMNNSSNSKINDYS